MSISERFYELEREVLELYGHKWTNLPDDNLLVQAMREALVTAESHVIPILAYENGKRIGTYNSHQSCARILGITTKEIKDVLDHKARTARGVYTFKMGVPPKNYSPLKADGPIPKEVGSKKCIVYKDGIEIARGTVNECCNKLNIKPTTIEWYAYNKKLNSRMSAKIEGYNLDYPPQ